MDAQSIDFVCDSEAAKSSTLQVQWLQTHSRVHVVEVRRGDVKLSKPPKPGHLSVSLDHGFAPGDKVRVTARYSGAPLQLVVSAAGGTPPTTTLDQFQSRKARVQAAECSRRQRLQTLFVTFDEQTHLDLESQWTMVGPDNPQRRRGAIHRMTDWLWRNLLGRGAAWAHDLELHQPKGPQFDDDVVYLSGLQLGLLGSDLELIKEAFECFANGELADPVNVEQGGPDGAYHALFACFAFLAAEHPAVAPAERNVWQQLLPCLVGTIEIFTDRYWAPAGRRHGRRKDFSVAHLRADPCSDARKLEIRQRHEKMSPAQLSAVLARWVADKLGDHLRDLGA